MGNSLTVDSDVSRLEDILEVDTSLLRHIHLKKEVPDIVNFHLKVCSASLDVAALDSGQRTELS